MSYQKRQQLPPRVTFVKQYFGFDPNGTLIDVGFHHLAQGWEQRLRHLVKQRMSIEQLLSHKFVVSIEGNDVATNIKWVMASNSVPFMPRPAAESWGLEGTLIAGVHYVELLWDEAAMSWDLEEKIRFCIDHDAECKEIAMNGQRFMEHYRFCDREYQRKLEAKVVDRYCQQISIQLDTEEEPKHRRPFRKRKRHQKWSRRRN